MSKSIRQLDQELEQKNLQGLWNEELWNSDARLFTKDPKTMVQPCVWKWADIESSLREAGDLVGLGGKVERRTVRLQNPGLKQLQGQKHATTHTIHMSVQLLKPGELASSHRHNFGAFRFVVRGRGAYTVVDGEQFFMEPGDLILNPPMTWHGHGNETEPIMWLDGLDYPLVLSLQVLTWEPFPGGFQPVKESYKSTGHRLGMVRPVWEKAAGPLAYKWSDTYRTLKNLEASEGSPFDGVALEFVNPADGGHTFTTMACGAQMLRPGEITRTHRHNSSTIYHAFRGSGATTIDGKKYEWNEGDCFVVPLWSWHSHQNASKQEEAILFSVNDQPTLEALKLYREEAGEAGR
ncbi:MAG TPA: cupin domain-containing protein [Candidatus Binatia bacterium]|jgi:gentisate 1,2-dioxygenase